MKYTTSSLSDNFLIRPLVADVSKLLQGFRQTSRSQCLGCFTNALVSGLNNSLVDLLCELEISRNEEVNVSRLVYNSSTGRLDEKLFFADESAYTAFESAAAYSAEVFAYAYDPFSRLSSW